MFISVMFMTKKFISKMVMPTIRHIGEWWWQGVFKPSGKTWRILKKEVVSRIMLAYNQWLFVCWSQFILIEDMMVMMTMMMVMLKINTPCSILSWLQLFFMIILIGWQFKNEPTLSNCEVIAPGRGNIRPSSKNSPQFQKSFTHNQSTRKYKLAKRMSVKTIS